MPRVRLNVEGLDPIDQHVGNKVKARRLMLGWSQEELAKIIGITFQQVQKYERGTNRISVSRLTDISKALKSPVEYFLEGIPTNTGPNKRLLMRGVSDSKQSLIEPEALARRDVLELVRAYQKISAPKLKKQLIEMAKAMAKD